jgi:nucleotide-binding universal stress UspA family protein
MYRHLMVPLDDSALSAETAGKAVRLARTLGAKVTFFHAQEDYGATSVGALQRVIAPADFNEGMAGEARAILAKAEAVAREAGVTTHRSLRRAAGPTRRFSMSPRSRVAT